MGAIAIAGVTPSVLEPTDETPLVSEAPPPDIDARPEDIPMAIVAAVMAASVFLPWYQAPIVSVGAKSKMVTGWETGTWGPVIFFLGIGALALIGLRRMRVRVALPFPETIVLEAIGWIATLTAIIKARFRPHDGTLQFGLDHKIWIAVGSGLALALLAGRASGKTAFVSVPGWYRGRAGKLGLAVLLLVIAGGAAFGLTNSYKTASDQAGGPGRPNPVGTAAQPRVVKGVLPTCAKSFPLPAAAELKPFQGTEGGATNSCVALLTTSKKAADVVAAFKTSLTQAGYKYKTTPSANNTTLFTLTGPKCGQIQVVAINQTSDATKKLGNTFASLILSACTR